MDRHEHEHHPGHDPMMSVTDELLREILSELKQNNRLLYRILQEVTPQFPEGFTIQGDSMIALSPGNSPQFTATPVPAGSSLGSVVPTWTTSDPVNAPISVDVTGLVATCDLSASIAVGASVTLSISATSSDGSQTATGSVTFTVVAGGGGNFPTSFSVAQTS